MKSKKMNMNGLHEFLDNGEERNDWDDDTIPELETRLESWAREETVNVTWKYFDNDE